MHPILASLRRLTLYLLAWIPILALLCLVPINGTSGAVRRDGSVKNVPADIPVRIAVAASDVMDRGGMRSYWAYGGSAALRRADSVMGNRWPCRKTAV